MQATIDYQPSMWNLLERLESELRQMAREARVRRNLRGPVDKDGNLRERGRKMGYCSHPECGGYRSVWTYRGLRICGRHWRTRKALYKVLKSFKVREDALAEEALVAA